MSVGIFARRRARLAAALLLVAGAGALVAMTSGPTRAAWARGLVDRILTVTATPAVPGDTVVIYGPLRVTSVSGSQTVDVERFTVTTQPDRQYLLELTRGDASGGAMPTGLSVMLNGSAIASATDFAAGARKITRVVTLAAIDTVSLTVSGSAGATAAIRVLEVASPMIYVYGPATFVRETGIPEGETVHFSFGGAGGAPYRMCILNGLSDGTLRASSATIILNGQTIVTQSDLNQQVGTLSRDVALVQGDNVMSVTIASKPSSRVTMCVTATDITPPTLTIDAPAPNAITRDATTAVSGTVTDQTATKVTVNGGVTVRSGSAYSATASLVEGSNTILVRAVDAAGNATDSTRTIIRDSEAPVITIETPAADRTLTNADSIDVAGGVTDRTAITVNIGGFVTATDANGHFARRIALDAGTNFITVSATDQAGNTASAVRQVVQDKTPPVVTIGTPSEGALTKLLSTQVTGTATDDSPLTLTVNGTSTSVATNGGFAGDVALTTEGANAIVVVATDAAGNATTVTRTVNRDTQAPVITVGTPAVGARTNQNNISVTGSVADANTVTVTVAGASTPVDASGSFAATAPLASEGDNQIAIVATDAAGNVAATTRTVDRDTQGPTLAIVSPAQDTLTRAATVVIDGAASDRSGVTVTVNGATITLENGAFAESRTLSEGSNSFTVVATDGAGNTTTATRLVASDRTPPALALLSPAPDTLTNAAAMTLRGRVYDATTITLTVNGVPATIAADSTFSADVTLTGDGALSYPIVATDAAGNTSQVVATVQRDVTAPVVAIVSPAQGIVTKNEQASVSGTVSDAHATRVSVNGVAMGVSNGTFAGAVPLDVEGVNTLTATAIDAAGNSADAVATITRDTQSPVITIDAPASGATTPNSSIVVRGHVADASIVELAVNGAPTPVGADGSYSATVALVRGTNPIGLHAVDAAGNAGDASVSVTRKTLEPGVPPDPATVAPPLDLTVASVPSKVLEFLYSGTDPIQKGVAAGTIDKIRAAVIRGRVLQRASGDTASEPLQGVDVTILGHPELGTTKSREDGWYDMVVNGGGALTVTFSKSGYLPAERNVTVPWQSYSLAEDVLLLRPDSVVTTIAMGSAQVQLARGSVATDEDGPRQATLIVPAGTQATMTLPNGTVQSLSSLAIRATEFTVGPSGSAAMPGVLPTTSSYTYAVQLSADQAVAAGVAPQDVVLSKPVPLYLENFLDIPVGTAVPVGAYDARLGQWVAQNNGRVIKILSTDGGIAQIDANGDGAADTDAQLAALGVDAAERAQVAITYQPGATLWRAPVLRLWPYDLNYGSTTAGIEPIAQINPGPIGAVRAPQCATKNADPIACEIQVARQAIGVTGAPFTLAYTSARSRGAGERSLDITLTGPTIPADLKGVELAVSVAGQNFTKTFDPAANLVYHFVWDGNDAYGRPVQGYQRVLIRIGHLYPVTYRAPAQQLQSFGLACDAVPDKPGYCNLPADMKTRPRAFAPRSSWLTAMLGGWNAQPMGFGGFTPSILHTYDPIGKVLQMGDGTRRVAERMGAVVKTVAGKGGRAYSGDGGAAVKAQFLSPAGVSIGPDGSIFIADKNNARVRKVLPNGSITTIAGTGNYDCCDSRSGIRALDANFGFVQYVIATPDGGVLVANQNDYEIRRVWPNGTITVIAGLRFGGSTAEGIAATSAAITVAGMAQGPDGSIYVAGNGKIRRITPAGSIVTVAGNGGASPGQNEVPALQTAITNPQAITVGSDGTIYFFEFFGGVTNQDAIRKITPDGIVHLVQGRGAKNLVAGDRALDGSVRQFLAALAAGPDGTLYAADDFGVWRVTTDGKYYPLTGNDQTIGRGFQFPESPAIRTQMRGVAGLAFGNTGELYVSISDSARVQRVTAPMPGVALGQTVMSAADLSEAYVFDQDGRHVSTREPGTGATKWRFAYATDGTLSGVYDRNGRLTVITRSAAGLAIVGPSHQQSTIQTDSSGLARSIVERDGMPLLLDYHDGILVATTDPLGHNTRVIFDSSGALISATNRGGQTSTLSRTSGVAGATLADSSPGGRSEQITTLYQTDGSTIIKSVLQGGDETTVTVSNNGTLSMSQLGGATVTVTSQPDPQFGMSAPLEAMSLALANGQQLNSRMGRGVLYDANGEVAVAIDSVVQNGRVTTTAFDYSTRVRTTRTPAGREKIEALDGLGRVVSDSVPGVLAMRYEYDSAGHVTTVTQGSRRAVYTYDDEGRLAGIRNAYGSTDTIRYDAASRLQRKALSGGRDITFVADSGGQLRAVTTPAGGTHSFTYTTSGEIRSYSAPGADTSAATVRYSYDADGLLGVTIRNGTDSVKYTYDKAGRPSTIAAANGVYRFGYDSLSGVATSQSSPDGETIVSTYDGAMVKAAAWRGLVIADIANTYDGELRTKNQSVTAGGSTSAVGYTYDLDGLITSAGPLNLSYGIKRASLDSARVGRVKTAYSIDSTDAIQTISASTDSGEVFREEITRDLRGRVIGIDETVGKKSQHVSYDYDSAGFLYRVTRNGVLSSQYAYDLDGNRTRLTTSKGVVNGLADLRDRLISYGDETFRYDDAGSLILRAKTSTPDTVRYAYSPLGQLVTVIVKGDRIDYGTDAVNRRIAKRLNGQLVQTFIYASGLAPIAELDGQGKLRSRFIYATRDNVPEVMIRDGVTYRLVVDDRGSVRVVVNASTGEVAQQIDYDEFGVVVSDSRPGFQPFGFAGGIYDAASGLVHFGARDYDPSLGRWISADPILFKGGTANLYLYVANDPANRTDPSGTQFLADLGAAQTMQFALQGARAAAFGAASSAAFSISTQLIFTGEVEWGDVGTDAALGAALGGAGTALKYLRFVRGLRAAKALAVIGTTEKWGGQYLQVAERLGARSFSIPDAVWETMSQAERRLANEAFLERAMARGSEFFLETPLSKIYPGSTLEWEVGYLLERGYRVAADGMRLVLMQ